MMNIMHPALRRLDLNLLPVFDAIYRHRSVRLAADELAMSTSLDIEKRHDTAVIVWSAWEGE